MEFAHEIEFHTDIQREIYNALALNGAMTRDEICKQLGFGQYQKAQKYSRKDLSGESINVRTQYYRRTTAFDNLCKGDMSLVKRGLVEKFTKHNGVRGRPKIYFKIINEVSE